MNMGFYEFMRAGHVKRWHVVNTVREQSIAEHSFLVAMIALELNKSFGDKATVDGILPSHQVLAVVMGSLFHDMPEVRYGDIPTPGKQFLKSVCGDPDVFTDIDIGLLPEMPYVNVRMSEFTAQIIKMADAIEAAHWIRDNGAGAHAEIVADKTWGQVEKLVLAYTSVTGVDWYGPVNGVLMSLGMPYISRTASMARLPTAVPTERKDHG